MEPSGWPPCVLEENLVCGISGYLDDEVIIYTDGPIVRNGFNTEPAQSSYEIESYYQWEQISLSWSANVNYGPEREAEPISTSIQIHHGCEAHDIAYDPQYPVPSGDTVSCGDVKDAGTGNYTSAFSPSFTLHLVPKIEIDSPENRTKFTFDDQSPGRLTIAAEATVYPPESASDLVWSITEIAGSDLNINAGDPPTTVSIEFSTLPEDNEQFGEKYIKVAIPAYNVADSVFVMVFFPKYADNNPEGLNWRNWFYYWRQTDAFQPSGLYDSPGEYCGGDTCGAYIHYQLLYWVCDCASEYVRLFECAGQPVIRGIDSFAGVCIHEHRHMVLWRDWYMERPDGSPPPYDPILDSPIDLDNFPDVLEEDPVWDPNNEYSPWFWDTDGDERSDFDELCYKEECNWIVGSADYQDWANPGHQY